jgi:hypothetical protein
MWYSLKKSSLALGSVVVRVELVLNLFVGFFDALLTHVRTLASLSQSFDPMTRGLKQQ